MSKISEYFVAALKAETDKQPRGTKKRLADQVRTTPSHITDILQGRKYGSEEMKRNIAETMGWDYEEFLKYGKCLLEGKEYTAPENVVNSSDMEDYIPIPFMGKTSSGALNSGSAPGRKGTGGGLIPLVLFAAAPMNFVRPLGRFTKKWVIEGQEAGEPDGNDQPILMYKPLLGRHQDSRSLVALELTDKNMAPTIPVGAIIIVDLGDRELVDDKVYLLDSENGSLLVSRIKCDSEAIILTNDNPDFPPKILKNAWDKTVLGKVIRSEHPHD